MSDSAKLRKIYGILWLIGAFVLFAAEICIIWIIAIFINTNPEILLFILPFLFLACLFDYSLLRAYNNFLEVGKYMANEKK